MNRTVIFLALFSAAGTASGQMFGPELPVSAPSYGLGSARHVASASNGEGFLVVWNTGSLGSFASRVTLSGELQDPAGIPLGTDSNTLVASAGGHYLVVTFNGARIIRADGSVGPKFVIDLGCQPAFPVLLSSGTHYFFGSPSCGSILDPEGRVVQTVSIPQEAIGPLRGVGDPSGFLIVSHKPGGAGGGAHPLATKIDLAGRKVFETFLSERGASAMGGDPPRVASNGREYLLAWISPWGVHGTRLSTQGEIIGDELLFPTAFTRQEVRLTSDGEDFLVIITHQSVEAPLQIVVFRNGSIVADRVVAKAPVVAYYSYEASPIAVASTRGKHLISTIETVPPIDFRGKPFEGSISRLFDRERMEVERVLPTGFSAAQQSFPSAASDGENLLVAWTEFEREKGLPAVYVNLVSRDGLVFPTALEIYDFPTPQSSPAVSFDGVNYLVVWEDYQRIFGQFLSRRRELVGDRFVISEGASRPQITFTGTNYIVAWYGLGGINISRVNPAGVLLDQPPARLATRGSSFEMAWNGERLVLIWVDYYDCIRCYRITLSGATYDPESREVSRFEPDLFGPVVQTYPPPAITAALGCNDMSCLLLFNSGQLFSKEIRSIVFTRSAAPRRARPVVRGSARHSEVFYDESFSSYYFIVPREEGFTVFLVPAEGRPRMIELDPAGREVSQKEMSETDARMFSGAYGIKAYRVGESVAFVYARATNDTFYGGALRGFVRFSN